MPFQSGSQSTDVSQSRERRVALVIGNSRYRHAPELANPVNDAEAMAAVLAHLGFDVVTELDLELHKMGDVQAAFGAKLRSKPDIALCFYAGHALQVKGLNYLVPTDGQIEVPEHLNFRAIRFNDIFDPMTEGASASLIFLDACRDNPFTRNLARSLGETARGSIRGGLAKVEKVAGSFIAYATAPDEVAFDGEGEHSPFTAALLKHIETPGLSVSDMMIDVRNAVLAETQGRQEPWDQSSLRARFCFVPKIEEPKTDEPAKRLQLTPSADEWAAVQNTTSLAVLASFKERYPDQPWSEYADIRMKELREADEKRRKAGPPAGAGIIAALFIALVLPVQFFLAALFLGSEWNWIGANSAREGGMATGLLLAFALALALAGALVYWRRGNLSSMEISLYWVGCTLASMLGLGSLFTAQDWSWLGTNASSDSATGLLLVFALALASATALVYRRRSMLSGVEIGAYWVGCTLVFIPALIYFFLANNFHYSVGLFVGFAVPLVSGAALAYWWRTHNRDSPDTPGQLPAPIGPAVNPVAKVKAYLAFRFYPAISRFRVGMFLLLGVGSLLLLVVFRQWDLPLGEQVTQQPAPSSAAAVSSENLPPTTTSPFGIVAGSDPTESAAQDELARARAAGFDEVSLFLRKSAYQTVILFPDRATAEANLAKAKKAMRPDAYVVDLNDWCPAQKNITQDLVACEAGAENVATDVELKSSGLPPSVAQAVKSENPIPTGTPRFGILVERHSEAANAEDRLLSIRMADLGSARIFRRRDLSGVTWYWPVILFPNRATADASLAMVQRTMGQPNAFVMDINLWCPTQQNISSDLVVCATNPENIPANAELQETAPAPE